MKKNTTEYTQSAKDTQPASKNYDKQHGTDPHFVRGRESKKNSSGNQGKEAGK